MKPRSAFFATILASLAPWLQASPLSETYRVAGVVVNSTTDEPVPKVRLILRSPDNRTAPEFAVSSENGRFVFSAVPAGKFRLTATRRGFASQSYGQSNLADALGTAVVTGPGLDMQHLVFRLIPPAAISGRVTDDHGDPIPRGFVGLYRDGVLYGKRRVFETQFTYTNDAGEYRFPGVGAGSYYVAAAGQPWYVSNGPGIELGAPNAGGSFAHLGCLPVFYPNTSDPNAASPIVLRPGEEAAADLVLPTVPGANVTVDAGSSASLDFTSGAGVAQLSMEGVGGTRLYWPPSLDAGIPMFPGVPPGRYRLSVRKNQGSLPSLSGWQDIEVGSSDMEVKLAPGSLPSVSGRVVIDPPGSGSVRPYWISLRSEDSLFFYNHPIGPNGTFQLPPMPPERFRVYAGGSSALYNAGVTSDTAPVVNGVVDLRGGGDVQILVHVSAEAARLHGYALRGGKPVPGVFVVLAPRSDTHDPIDYRGFQTDADGSYDFPGLRPGQYVLFAVQDGSEFEYANPTVLRPFLASGQRVDLAASATKEINLTLPEPKPRTATR